MQAILLQLCFVLGVREVNDNNLLLQITQKSVNLAYEQTSALTDFSSLVEGLHSGPKTRGQERKEFDLTDLSRGDVYRCILLSMRDDPPQLSLTYDEILRRSKQVARGESPVGSSLNSALQQMQQIAEKVQPQSPVIEWDEDVLDVVDPYFLFFLRWSSKTKRLGNSK